MIKTLTALVCMMMLSTAHAQVDLFTEHQAVYMAQHGVNKYIDVPFKTGDYPYIGRLGLEYARNNWSYQLSYIHRSNVDITDGNEYNYNGVSIGIKYRYCLVDCK